MRKIAGLTLALLTLCTVPAVAGPSLDRIRAQNVLRCGAESRPGLIEQDSTGRARGLYLEVCRAIALAILPESGRLEFTLYDGSKDYDAVRKGTDDIFFLTAAEVLEENLAGAIIPGPTVFNMTTGLMVSEKGPLKSIPDLEGKAICFMQGSGAHRHVEAYFAAHALDFRRMGYQEDSEFRDAYSAQQCLGMVSEVTALAQARLVPDGVPLQHRILPEPLAIYPIFIASPSRDGELASIAAWTVHTLIRAEVPVQKWAAGGIDALRLPGKDIGLADHWQDVVIKKIGTYGDVFERTLGAGSPYKLPRGVNAQVTSGGLLLAPFDE